MAEMNCGNTVVVAVCSGSALLYSVYHAYMYDGCRCLVPSRKDWFRALLMWMLLCSSFMMLTWAVGWAYVKYKLGWVYMGAVVGARPWPSAMFPDAYLGFNKPLTFALTTAYSLLASLNAEETLFWYHGMRSIRAPHRARAWIGSTPFWVWVGVTLVITGLQLGIPWISYDPMDIVFQLSLELAVGGFIELMVVLAATIVLLRFPKFMDDVKASGAGPDVRARLHFYHEANKVRTLFRFIFCGTVLVLGIDGMTEAKVINMTPLADDCIVFVIAGSFCFVVVTSVVVYLPRTYGDQRVRVMVGVLPRDNIASAAPGPRIPHRGVFHNDDERTGHFAIVSLLREGGQIGEDEEVDVAYGLEGDEKRLRDGAAVPGVFEGPAGHVRQSRVYGKGDERGGSEASLAKETKVHDWNERPALPAALEHFTSPIVPHIEDTRKAGPVQVRVRVERQVHQD